MRKVEMILMIGKNLRRRAFAAVIAGSAALIALLLSAGAILGGVFLMKNRGYGEENDASLLADEGALVMKSGDASVYDPERDGEVMRLHIVANSDSSEDQRVKLLVRNRLLELARLSDAILQPSSIDDAESILKTAGSTVLNAVRTVLKEEGASYDAQLIIGDFDFPEREYDGKLYPAGKYRALRILLGEAEGKNWWCILFPPLCIINGEERLDPAGKADASSEKSLLLDRDGTVRFESLLVKLFNRIFLGEDGV